MTVPGIAQMEWETRLHIGGEEVNASAGATYTVSSPASGRHVATVADASVEDVNRAAVAASESFQRGVWRRRTAAQRGAVLYRIGQAKRPETRARKVSEFVAMLARGETVHPQKRTLDDV